MNRRVIGGASIYTGAILWLLRSRVKRRRELAAPLRGHSGPRD